MFDGVHMKRITTASIPIIIASKIDKVYHPNEKLIIIKLNSKHKGYNKLLISCDPGFCTVHFTTLALNNPLTPSTFCMVLRKHLEGSTIIDFKQLGLERLVQLTVSTFNDIGEPTIKTLHLELMGKYSNVILSEKDTIIDALYKYPIGVNGFREILPKRTYHLPPMAEKINPLTLTEETLSERIYKEADTEQLLSAFLQKLLEGFSKQTMVDLLKTKNLETLSLNEVGSYELNTLISLFKTLKKDIEGENIEALKALDAEYNAFYTKKIIESKTQKLKAIVTKELKKITKKETIHLEKIASAEDGNQYRLKGELLSANIYQLKQRVSEITVPNYFDENMAEITIALDKSLSPSANVKKYFKRYHKIKEGKKKSEFLLKDIQEKKEYLETILLSFDFVSTIDDLDNIEEELKEHHLIKETKKKKKQKKQEIVMDIKKEETSTGFTLLIGKNNKQNEHITFKMAKTGDLWFHAKNYPGSHVVLKNPNDEIIDDQTIQEAATFAAQYSKGNKAPKIDVDYTDRKYLKKHPSHLPGKVFYTDYKTIHIEL